MKKLPLFGLILALALLLSCAAPSVENGYLLVDGKQTVPSSVVTLSEKEISFHEYRHFYLNVKTDFDAGVADYWTNHPDDETALKETVLDYLKQTYAAELMASSRGISLNAEEQKAVQDQLSEIKSSLSDEEFAEQLSSFYLDETLYRSLLERNALYDKLYTVLTGEGGEISIDDAELSAYLAEYYLPYAQIYIDFKQNEGTNSYTNTEKVAKEAHERLLSGEDFYAVAFSLSDDQDMITDYKNGYLGLKSAMDEALVSAWSTLEEETFSAPILTSTGFYILKRLPLSDALISENREAILYGYEDATNEHHNGLLEDRFAELISEYAQAIEVSYSAEYDKISTSTLF